MPFLLELPMQGVLSLLSKEQIPEPEIAIVLGRGPKYQQDFAQESSVVWVSNQDLSFFVSGMTDSPKIVRLLVDMGVPKVQVKGERCSQTTWENGLFSELIVDSEETKNILLITDSAHMLRAFLVFKSFGFNVTPHPVELDRKSYFSPDKIRATLREYAALMSYGLSGKFRSYSTEKKIVFEAKANKILQKWNCKLD